MKIKCIQNLIANGYHTEGDVIDVTPKVARDLIGQGAAKLHRRASGSDPRRIRFVRDFEEYERGEIVTLPAGQCVQLIPKYAWWHVDDTT